MTNWIPAVTTLGTGVLGGRATLALTRARRRAAAAPPPDDERIRLERRANELIEALRELDVDRHHFTAEAFAIEKAKLEQEAASALRSRDDQRAKDAQKPL